MIIKSDMMQYAVNILYIYVTFKELTKNISMQHFSYTLHLFSKT